MRDRPQFHADQHRMFEHALDLTRDIGGDDADHRGPDQRVGDMAGPRRRIPDIDQPGRAVIRKAVADENDADYRNEGEQSLVASFTEARDEGGAMPPHGDENMAAE